MDGFKGLWNVWSQRCVNAWEFSLCSIYQILCVSHEDMFMTYPVILARLQNIKQVSGWVRGVIPLGVVHGRTFITYISTTVIWLLPHFNFRRFMFYTSNIHTGPEIWLYHFSKCLTMSNKTQWIWPINKKCFRTYVTGVHYNVAFYTTYTNFLINCLH